MTNDDILERRRAANEQQRRVVEASAPLFVEACPGAGKTRTIVDRHLTKAVSDRPGRALVSFTRASSAELRRRCQLKGRPELAEFPHFIGTIDRFLWQYLVRPALLPNRRWERIDSWDRINARVNDRWHLSDFVFRRDPDENQCRVELRQTDRNRADYVDFRDNGRITAVEDAALARRDELVMQGYITGHELRVWALYSARTDADQLKTTLRARFDELIVDEAQDCSLTDLAILEELRRAGLPLVLVGDLDQAIYEFRDARPDQVRQFGVQLGKTLHLTGNWRSSPAICALAHTLRQDTTGRPDDAVGDRHDDLAPVLLLPSRKNQIAAAYQQFHAHATSLGIARSEQLVVAHAGRRLPGPARVRLSGGDLSSSKQLAWAAAMIEDRAAPQPQVEDAFAVFERALLRVWCPATDDQSIDALCESHRVDRTGLRQLVRSLRLPSLDGRTFTQWCADANRLLAGNPPSDHMTRSRKGRLVAGPDGSKQARKVVGTQPASAITGGTRGAVIHQVKGDEADAVLLIVPEDIHTAGLVDAWIRGDAANNEGLRVLYVAATRARRLLAISIPEDHHGSLAQHLASRGVPLNRFS
ncbi:UvrD-helicase domain-containing protein [Pseudonocardia xinjiangensis]|uniref:UvrD-helicase domain-containing protein n=1 Tax=Pseudonocardia xinjiangensis TaxID=75289 RepID=UPI003D8AB0CB